MIEQPRDYVLARYRDASYLTGLWHFDWLLVGRRPGHDAIPHQPCGGPHPANDARWLT